MKIPIFYTCILFCLGTTIKAQDASTTQRVPAEVADKQFLNDLERGEQKPLPPAFRGAPANGLVENSPVVKERESRSRSPENVADQPLDPSRESAPIPNIHEGAATLEPERGKSLPSVGEQPASQGLQKTPQVPGDQRSDMGIAPKPARAQAPSETGKMARDANPEHLADTKKYRKMAPIASNGPTKTKSAGVTFQQAPVASRVHAGQGSPINEAPGISEAAPREVSPGTATDFGGAKRESIVQQKQYVAKSGQVITVTRTTTFTAPPEHDERDRDKGFFHRLFRRQIDVDPAD